MWLIKLIAIKLIKIKLAQSLNGLLQPDDLRLN